MKNLDFSHPGQMPGGQDRLNYLQEAWTEAIGALAKMGGDATGPFVVSGCTFTRVNVSGTYYNWSVTDGWIYYNDEFVRVVAGGPYVIDESVDAPYLLLSRSSLPLTYNTGGVHNVINDATINLGGEPIGTPNTGILIAVSSLKPFGREATEGHITVATGSGAGTIIGDIYYRKNFLNNTLQLHADLITSSPSDFAAWPHTSTEVIGTLPIGYRPVTYRVAFNVNMPKGSDVIKDVNGTYFSRLNGSVNTDGTITIDWIKPDVGYPLYLVEFNVIISLD